MHLPSAVQIVEVGPGEGFFRERLHLPIQVQVDVVRRVVSAGVAEVVAARFAEEEEPPPRLADAPALFGRLLEEPPEGTDPVVLAAAVSGPRSAARAAEAGAERLVAEVPATEGWARKLGGRSGPDDAGVEGALERLAGISAMARDTGVSVTVTVPAAFGCPVDGPVDPEAVADLVERITERAAPARITLSDAPGLATPVGVEELVGIVLGSRADREASLAVRLADTRGLALANALAALQAGVRIFEGAIAGVGGSPVEPGAPGTVPTEDLAYLCGELGVATGLDFRTLRRAARRVVEGVARPLPSRTVNIDPRERVYARITGRG